MTRWRSRARSPRSVSRPLRRRTAESPSIPWGHPMTGARYTAGPYTVGPYTAGPYTAGPYTADTVHRRRWWIPLTAGAVLFAAAGGPAHPLAGRSGTTDTGSALASAAAATRRSGTAHVALSMAFAGAGGKVAIAGNGDTNLVSNASNLTLDLSVGPHEVAERALVVGSTVYVNLGSLVGQIVPGKSWVSEPAEATSSGSGRAATGGGPSGQSGP